VPAPSEPPFAWLPGFEGHIVENITAVITAPGSQGGRQ
jgi:hypothetical protein